jgi:hypothetical protein
VLSLRYKVAMLIPAVGYTMIFAMVIAIARGDPIILAIALVVAGDSWQNMPIR